MTLRCKPGDIAIVLRDHSGCEDNIGRLVEVLAPSFSTTKEAEGIPCWLIRQVDADRPWSLVERDGQITREFITRASSIFHPDTWMLPIRPPEEQDRDAFTEKNSTPIDEMAEFV